MKTTSKFFGLILTSALSLGSLSFASASSEAPPVIERVSILSKSADYSPGDILTLQAVISGGEPEITDFIFYTANQLVLGVGNIFHNKSSYLSGPDPQFESFSSSRSDGRLITTFVFSLIINQKAPSGTYPIATTIYAADSTGLTSTAKVIPSITVKNTKILAPGVVKPTPVADFVDVSFLQSIKDFKNQVKLPRISALGSNLYWEKAGGGGCELQGRRFYRDQLDTLVFQQNGGNCTLNVRTFGDDYTNPLNQNVSITVPKLASTAIPQSKLRVYANCTEMNKVYPGGVARNGAKNLGGSVKKLPYVNNSLYAANIKSDKDKDGIACEK